MLKIDNLQVSYGGIRALRGISLEVPDGKIVTLIGANGAGKSTTLRTISGLVKADSGSITYDGQELLGNGFKNNRNQGRQDAEADQRKDQPYGLRFDLVLSVDHDQKDDGRHNGRQDVDHEISVEQAEE